MGDEKELASRVKDLEESIYEIRRSRPLACYDCGLRYDRFPDLIVSQDNWHRIAPHGDEGGILCPNCMHARFEAIGADSGSVRATFRSGPFADRTAAESLAADWQRRAEAAEARCAELERERDTFAEDARNLSLRVERLTGAAHADCEHMLEAAGLAADNIAIAAERDSLRARIRKLEAVVERAREQERWAASRCRVDGSEDERARAQLTEYSTVKYWFDSVLRDLDTPAPSPEGPTPPQPDVATLRGGVDAALGEALHEIGGISGSRGLGEFRLAIKRAINRAEKETT